MRIHFARSTDSSVSVAVALVLTLLAGSAGAHPMGNFSVGHYTRLKVRGDQLEVLYRIDLAEIPTVEEMRKIETDADGQISEAAKRTYLAMEVPRLTAGQAWQVNGVKVVPQIVRSDLRERSGAGNLPTLLITIEYRMPLPAGSRVPLDYQDSNFSQRRGWREIIAQPGDDGRIIEANVPANDRSNALDAYPADLSSAPSARSAHIVFGLAPSDAGAVSTAGSTASSPTASVNTATPRDRFTALISTGSLSTTVVLWSILMAFVLGSFHALSPGHGKTVVAAYLVGSRGTPRHAFLLGAVVTMTHVAGVFALGLVVLFASKYVIPERVYPWLGFGSGLLIACLGLWQFTRRYAAWFARRTSVGHFHHGHFHIHATDGHLHDHEHHHGPGGHTHEMPDRITPANLIALGVSGGIVPCPSALVVLLGAIALHRTALGLLLIVAFSFGLASVLITIGIIMLRARNVFDRFQWKPRWTQRLPIASSLVITLLGLTIAGQALVAGGIVQINL